MGLPNRIVVRGLWRKKKGRGQTASGTKRVGGGGSSTPTAGRYHAVSIRADHGGCDAVRQLRDVRYLSSEAPPLPMTNCVHPGGCRCRYRHWADRRQGPRRDSDVGLPGHLWTQEDRRRVRGGRRRSDR